MIRALRSAAQSGCRARNPFQHDRLAQIDLPPGPVLIPRCETPFAVNHPIAAAGSVLLGRNPLATGVSVACGVRPVGASQASICALLIAGDSGSAPTATAAANSQHASQIVRHEAV